MMRLPWLNYAGSCVTLCCLLGANAASAAAAPSSATSAMTMEKPPLGPKSAPKPSAGVPASTCRPGFTQQGFWICMSGCFAALQYDNAGIVCQDRGARVADVNDWRYRIFRGDGVSAPVG